MKSLALILLLATSLLLRASDPVRIFNGRDLSGFVPWTEKDGLAKDPRNVFTVRDGNLRVSGSEMAYLVTTNTFTNYRLTAEYRWAQATPTNNSGIFVHAAMPTPTFAGRSFECNLGVGKTGDIVLIDGASLHVGFTAHTNHLQVIANCAGIVENPVGEWNTYEILCQGGELRLSVNGHVTAEGSMASPASGHLYIQSNKGGILFRRLEIQPLP